METSVGVPSPTGNEHFQIPLNFWLSETERFLRPSSARYRLVSKNTVYSSVFISKRVLSKHAAAGRSEPGSGLALGAPMPSGDEGGWSGGTLPTSNMAVATGQDLSQLRTPAKAMDGNVQDHSDAVVQPQQVLRDHLTLLLLLAAPTSTVSSSPTQGVNRGLRRSVSDD